MRLIHLSDFHFRGGIGGEDIVFKSLLEDIKKNSSDSIPNAIVISGDIAYNPDLEHVYERFFSKFAFPLSLHFGIELDRILIVPGNHDVSFNYMKSKDTEYNYLQQLARKSDFEEHALKYNEYGFSVSRKFFQFSESLGHKWKNPFVYSFTNIKGINFICINTAFSCSLEGSKNDFGNLDLSINDIELEVAKIDDKNINVAVLHHPIDNIVESSRIRIQRLIDKNIDIVLFGHVHQQRPRMELGGSTSTAMLQSGAAFNKSELFKGYCIIDVLGDQKEHIKVTTRTFWDERQEFDVATNVAPNGVLFTPNTMEADFEAAKKADPETLAVACLEAADELRALYANPMFNGSIDIDPILKETVTSISADDDQVDEARVDITIDEIADSVAHFVVSSQPESGSTTIMRELAARILERSAANQAQAICSIINGNSLQLNPYSILSAIKKGLPKSISENFDVEEFLRKKLIHVLIDDSPRSNNSIESIIDIISRTYPNFRCIFLVKSQLASISQIGAKLSLDSRVRQVTLLPLDRIRARKIIFNYSFQNKNIEKEALLDETIVRFKALGIPLTHVYLGIYLAVIDRAPNFNPINTSTLVDRFVEGVLHRSATENIFRGEFDYDNQRSALGALAEKLARSGAAYLTYAETVSTINEHLNQIGIATDVGKVIETFIGARILYREDNMVSFTSMIFLSYFLSVRMKDRREFFEWVTDKGRIYNFVEAFEIYCGLNRSDSNALERAAAAMAAETAIVEPFFQVDELKTALQDIAINSENLEASLTKQAENAISYAANREAASKHISDQEGPVTGAPARVHDEEIPIALFRWVYSLSTMSVALKNLENVPKSEKIPLLKQLIENWGLLASAATIALISFARDKEPIQIGDMMIDINIPDNLDADFLRKLALLIPELIFDVIKLRLGTQKLDLLLDEFDVEYLIDGYLKKTLKIEISVGEPYSFALQAARSFEDSAYISRLLYNHMLMRYIKLGTSDEKVDGDASKMRREAVATLHANCLGLSGPERPKFVAKRIQQLEHSLILAKRKRDESRRLKR